MLKLVKKLLKYVSNMFSNLIIPIFFLFCLLSFVDFVSENKETANNWIKTIQESNVK